MLTLAFSIESPQRSIREESILLVKNLSYSINLSLTTTLLNGGCVPQISRSFHFWLLDKTAPMAGKSGQPSHEPPSIEGKKDTHRTDIIYIVETRESRGGQPRNYACTQNSAATNTKDPHACGQQRLLTAQAYQC